MATTAGQQQQDDKQDLRRKVEIPDYEEALKKASKGLNLRAPLAGFNDPQQDAALEQRITFDGGNTSLVVGDVLVFEPSQVQLGIVNIGTRGAVVMLVPCGTIVNGHFNCSCVKQIYLSAFTKTIRVTDDGGNPVIGADGIPVVRDGRNNAVWEAMTALSNDLERKNWLAGRVLRVTEQVRDFGPAGYVQIGNSNIPKAHRLTTINLFQEVTLP